MARTTRQVRQITRGRRAPIIQRQYFSNMRVINNEIVGPVDDSRPIIVYPSLAGTNLTVAQGVTVSNVRPSSVGQSRR